MDWQRSAFANRRTTFDRPPPADTPPPAPNKRKLRAVNNRKAQDLFAKNKSQLASLLFERGHLQDGSATLNIDRAQDYLRQIYESPSSRDDEPFPPSSAINTHIPVSEDDIRKANWHHHFGREEMPD